jgi:hypothetical protein
MGLDIENSKLITLRLLPFAFCGCVCNLQIPSQSLTREKHRTELHSYLHQQVSAPFSPAFLKEGGKPANAANTGILKRTRDSTTYAPNFTTGRPGSGQN